jgi:protein-S-isoprenylcysteine O-methyltransferase Ste14
MDDAPSILVLASWAVFAVTWAIAALFVKRTVERSWGWGRLMLWAVVPMLFWTIFRSQSPGTWWLWTPTPLSKWLAATIVLFGLWVCLWARLVLGGNWSGAVTLKKDHELIERGPYRHVRHPIYSGLLLMAFGTAILHGRASEFVFCGLILLGFWFKLRAEEEMLTRHFPDAYPQYRRRVKALIPYVL